MFFESGAEFGVNSFMSKAHAKNLRKDSSPTGSARE
jgi:hypothetical protein